MCRSRERVMYWRFVLMLTWFDAFVEYDGFEKSVFSVFVWRYDCASTGAAGECAGFDVLVCGFGGCAAAAAGAAGSASGAVATADSARADADFCRLNLSRCRETVSIFGWMCKMMF